MATETLKGTEQDEQSKTAEKPKTWLERATENVRKHVLKIVADTRTKIQTLKVLHEEYKGRGDESLKGKISEKTEQKVMGQIKEQAGKLGVQKNILEKAVHSKLYEEFKGHKEAVKDANEPIRGTPEYQEAKESVVKNAEMIVRQLNENDNPQKEAIKQELLHLLRLEYNNVYRTKLANDRAISEPEVIKKAQEVLYRLSMRKDLKEEVYKLLWKEHMARPKEKEQVAEPKKDAFSWMDEVDSEIKNEAAKDRAEGRKPGPIVSETERAVRTEAFLLKEEEKRQKQNEEPQAVTSENPEELAGYLGGEVPVEGYLGGQVAAPAETENMPSLGGKTQAEVEREMVRAALQEGLRSMNAGTDEMSAGERAVAAERPNLGPAEEQAVASLSGNTEKQQAEIDANAALDRYFANRKDNPENDEEVAGYLSPQEEEWYVLVDDEEPVTEVTKEEMAMLPGQVAGEKIAESSPLVQFKAGDRIMYTTTKGKRMEAIVVGPGAEGNLIITPPDSKRSFAIGAAGISRLEKMKEETTKSADVSRAPNQETNGKLPVELLNPEYLRKVGEKFTAEIRSSSDTEVKHALGKKQGVMSRQAALLKSIPLVPGAKINKLLHANFEKAETDLKEMRKSSKKIKNEVQRAQYLRDCDVLETQLFAILQRLNLYILPENAKKQITGADTPYLKFNSRKEQGAVQDNLEQRYRDWLKNNPSSDIEQGQKAA